MKQKKVLEIKTVYFDTPMQEGRAIDIFIPEEIRKDKQFFFVHGGGWRAGGRANFHRIIE